MLDKITKYVKINDRPIVVGQTSSGIWYCKELHCQEVDELNGLIGKINKILNDYNDESKKTKGKVKKEKEKDVDNKVRM